MKVSEVDLNLLVVFETLFAERSVSRAAKRLGMAQSSFSGALARLRLQLDDELFVWTSKKMVPTPYALGIAPGVVEAIARLRATLERSATFVPSEARSVFTIGSSDYTSFVLLPAIFEAIASQAPGVSLRVLDYDKRDVARRVEGGEMDLALGVFADAPPRVVLTKLYPERFVGVCRERHPALNRHAIALSGYLASDHALVSLRGDAVGAVDQVLSQRGLSRRVRLVVPHMLSLPGTVAATDLLAAVPARVAGRFTGEGLVAFELPVQVPSWHVHMLWSASRRRDRAHLWLRRIVEGAAKQSA